ncbi:MAG: EAL domain-containing protein [Oscillospiraceae bacterium]
MVPAETDETETVVGAEALLRWEYKNGGYLYPPLLIALAAQDGLLDELGYWIFQQVCEASVQLEEMGYTGLNLSVNVSAAQLSDFAGRVRCIVRESGAQPANIGVELTEQTALSGSKAMMSFCRPAGIWHEADPGRLWDGGRCSISKTTSSTSSSSTGPLCANC